MSQPGISPTLREFDVVVAGGGTAGVVAAVAAARAGARTALVEIKGYPGGIAVEGGTALHSFYNLWKAFPNCEKRQVVKGIPQEIIERLLAVGGTSGHAEMSKGYGYDSMCTAIDTELYKLIALANITLNDGQIGECMRLLDGYWPHFLEENVPAPPPPDPVAQRPRPPSVESAKPSAQTGFLDRVRGYLPKPLRF